MKAAQERRGIPGVVLHQSSAELLRELGGEEVKRIVLGLLDYAATGGVPELSSAAERIAWAAMRTNLEFDRDSYEHKCTLNRYYRFLREAEKRLPREDCPSFEDWLRLSEDGSLRAAEVVLRLPQVNSKP